MNSTGFRTDKAGQGASNAVLLSPNDNVVVACRLVRAGERVSFGERAIIAANDVETGHKIACLPIARGRPVIKYSAPIGSALREIAVGEHVHLHNMRSDYIAATIRRTGPGT